MNKKFKTGILAFLLIIGVIFSGYADAPLKELQSGVMSFSEDLAKSLPFNTTLGLNWSSAYIGKLIPSVPPHFGVGAMFGVTTMSLPAVKDIAGYMGYELPFDAGKIPLPAYTVEARLGGLFLPFDLGVKFGYIPDTKLWGKKLNVDYLLVGADLRYALLDKKLPIIPKISIGVGLNYLKGGIGTTIGSAQEFTYGSDTLRIDKPELNFKWDTVTLDFKAQASISLLILTPYIGVGGAYGWSNAGYSVNAPITINGTNPLSPADISNIDNFLKSAGLDGVDIDSDGISSIIKNKAFSFRAFGGLSINVTFIKFDLTALYNFRDNNFGGSFGIRFQL